MPTEVGGGEGKTAKIKGKAPQKVGDFLATLKAAIQMHDGMTGPLKNMTQALNIVINTMESMQDVSGRAIDTAALQTAREGLARANVAAEEIEQTFSNIQGGARQATQQQQYFNTALNNGSSAADKLVGKVTSLVAAYVSLQGAQKTLALSDTLAQTEARLNLTVDDGGTVEEFQSKLHASALRTGSDYLDVASNVAKLGLLAGGAFSGNDEIIAFTELMNKAFTVSGASAQESSAAMYQLTQAMASGRLQGDEFRSIIENAPMLAQAIADYTGVGMEGLKEWASEGLITSDVIKNALFTAGAEIEDKFGNLPMTFGRVWNNIKDQAIIAFDPVLDKISDLTNSDRFWTFVNGGIGALTALADIALGIFDALSSAANLVIDNWSWISPIVWGIVGALVAYKAVSMAVNAVIAVTTIAENAKAAATAMATGATFAQTAAQYGLNAALMACPITWIVIGLMAIVAIIYAAVAAFNHFTDSSVSATGIICGAINVAASFVRNIFNGVFNFIVGLGIELYNLLASFANFFTNVFDDPVGAIITLFANLFDFIVGVVQSAAGMIDAILGTDLTSHIANFRDKVSSAVSDIVGDQVVAVEKLNAKDYMREHVWSGDAWDSGYSFGKGIEDKVRGMFDSSTNIPDYTSGSGSYDYAANIPDYASALGNTAANTANTADNTDKIAKTLSSTNEELKYLREIAERQAIDKTTSINVNIEMSNSISTGSDTDIDGLLDEITVRINEAVLAGAEGVYT